MKKNFISAEKDKNINRIIKKVFAWSGNSRTVFAFILLLYIMASILLKKVSQGHGIVMIFGLPAPIQAFTGVFSSLGNICIFFLVVFFPKTGFIVSLSLLLSHFPIIICEMFLRHNMVSVPGIFSNLLAILAINIIYLSRIKIEKYQKRLREQAITDSLTKLPNRFASSELIDELVALDEEFTVVSIDLNNFKNITDTMGRETGDKVLIEIAERWKVLSKSKRAGAVDFFARIGGDEFLLIINGHNSNEDIEKTINIYERELERRITIDNCDYFLTACFGYAEFPFDADTTDSLFSCADAAMHGVKRYGAGNCFLRFVPELLKITQMLEMERKIRYALENDLIFFYLQPQYDVSHKLRGFESLARMKDSDGSIILPSDFIPVAEKFGLVDKIDERVFELAADFMGKILKNNDYDITLCFNVSVRHLMKNDFLEKLRNVIDKGGVSAKNFEMEITESIMIDSTETALERINEVKKMGIQVAIDDFGTGYSSLSYLQKFPADLLKIDKSFIDVMNTNDSSKQYVASIVSIGHILNMKVLSEGVETPDQLKTLQDVGCDYIQGYIWGRPMTPEEAEKLVFEAFSL